jgi:protein-S-isoprenylcysteine O-methyltransferase Ste14
MELPMKSLLTALLWVLWCALHSTLIATTVTEYMKKKLGDQFRFYRLFYNTISLVTLIPLVYCSISVQEPPVFRWEGYLVIVRYLLLATSISLFFAAGRHYSMSELFGIRQIKTGRMNRALSEYNRFDTSGILGAIRHPWYSAGILLVWASDISLSILLINIIISTYFVIGTILEERKLLLEFGEKYREYQENVSMFIPYKWFKAKIAGRSRIGSFQKFKDHPPSIPVVKFH